VANENTVLPATAIQVLEVFLDVPDKRYYEVELTRRADLPAGAVRPELARLVAAGWVRTGLNALPNPGSRCRRRWYQLTDEGRQAGDRQPSPQQPRRRGNRAGWWRPRRSGAAARR
jgi:DNA-binding PadR family transcriptional regulator